MVRGLLRFVAMHAALHRYADPPRDFYRFFALGLIAGAFAVGAIAGRLGGAEPARDESDRVAAAQKAVARYAYEAFPRWVADHPDLACPVDRLELDRYLPDQSFLDPWGYPYLSACDHRGRLIAWSNGPDGSFHTGDDVFTR